MIFSSPFLKTVDALYTAQGVRGGLLKECGKRFHRFTDYTGFLAPHPEEVGSAPFTTSLHMCYLDIGRLKKVLSRDFKEEWVSFCEWRREADAISGGSGVFLD